MLTSILWWRQDKLDVAELKRLVALRLKETLQIRVNLWHNGHLLFQDGYLCTAFLEDVLAICSEDVFV